MNKTTYWLSITMITAITLLNYNLVVLKYGGTAQSSDFISVYLGLIVIVVLTFVYFIENHRAK